MNISVKTVPVRLTPYEDESILGFGLRVAEENWAIDGVRAVVKAIRTSSTSSSDYLVLISNLSSLSQLTTVDTSVLRSMAFWHLPQHEWPSELNIGRKGNMTSAISLSHKRSRLCVQCVKEKGRAYLRRLWDLKIYQCCHVHQCELTSVCPNKQCGAPLNWYRSSRFHCRHCGTDVREAPVKPVSEQSANLARVIASSLPMSGGGVETHSTILPELADISIRDLANILGFLAGWAKGARPITGTKLLCSGEDKIAECLRVCEPLFMDWPRSLYRKIDERITLGDSWMRPEERFPVIFKGVSRVQKALYPITRLRPVFMIYLAEFHPEYVAKCGGRHGLLEDAARHAGYVTLGEAAQLLHSTVPMIKKTAPEVKVRVHAPGDGEGPCRILKDDLKSLSEQIWFFRRPRKTPLHFGDQFLATSCGHIGEEREPRLRERVDTAQIGAMLGVSSATAARLRRDKLIGKDLSETLTSPATTQCVLDYLTSLEQSCIPCDDANLVPVTSLLKRDRQYWRVGFRAALLMIRDGKLPVRGVDSTEHGLRRILVSGRDLSELNEALHRS